MRNTQQDASVQHNSPSALAPGHHAAYVGKIPGHYHDGVGPYLFEPYARELARQTAARKPACVLETACGTGILTRRLREALPSDTRLTATDLNPPMLTVARRTVGAESAVEWQQADMKHLCFASATFDVVVCQFGLMFVPDKRAALQEARRVLKAGGTLLLATWRSLEHNPAIQLAHECVTALLANEQPTFYLTQTGYGEPAPMAELLREAGFQNIEAKPLQRRFVCTDTHALAEGLIRGFPIVDVLRARDPALIEVAVDNLSAAISEQIGKAPVEIPIEALLTSGVAPQARSSQSRSPQ